MRGRLFGDKNEFAIEYGLIKNPDNEVGIFGESWGSLRIWAKGIDLLEYKLFRGNPGGQPDTLYEWGLCDIAGWFSKNLDTILDEEELPRKVVAKNFLEFYDKYCEGSPDIGDDEFESWHAPMYEWNQKHLLRAAADGSLLPDLFLRSCNNKIELCWDNTKLYDDEDIFFKETVGCVYVDKNQFKTAILSFLKDFSNLFSEKYPENFKDYNLLMKKEGYF